MAVIQGLRLVEDRMYVGDWTRVSCEWRGAPANGPSPSPQITP
jgi:hypothetical protein